MAFDPKADLHEYLQSGREVMLWKLEGLSEYDIRRPLVPTGTNLLGLVQHVASIETGYFGFVGSIVLFIFSARQRDFDHADRLSLTPLEPDPSPEETCTPNASNTTTP